MKKRFEITIDRQETINGQTIQEFHFTNHPHICGVMNNEEIQDLGTNVQIRELYNLVLQHVGVEQLKNAQCLVLS